MTRRSSDRTNSSSRDRARDASEDAGAAHAKHEEPAIHIANLSVRIGSTSVLEAIDLEVERGDFVGIIGPNGAGKSVLLRTILGLIEPYEGQIQVFGAPPREARGRVGYVPQVAAFDRAFPISVLEVVLMGRLHRRPLFRRFTDEDREVARTALHRVKMDGLIGRQIGRLSGGEMQRVLIARALAMEADLLLLDEPTASLDPRAAHDLYDLMREILPGITILLVSHDVGVISEQVRRVICLNRRIVHDGVRDVTSDVLARTYGYGVSTLEHDHPLID